MKIIVNRFLIIMIIIITILIATTPCVKAKDVSINPFKDGSDFLSEGGDGNGNLSGAKTHIAALAGILYGLGALVAIIATIILGINYITASTSENKAELKKKAIVVAIGVFVLFMAGTIWQVLVSALSSAT